MDSCEPPFWNYPSIIFYEFSVQYKPKCEHSKWNFIMRIMLLSFLVGIIGSIFADLSFIMVALLFGAITTFAIIMTTPAPEYINKKHKDHEIREYCKEHDYNKYGHTHSQHHKNDGYKPLPFTVVVDPSRSQENYSSDSLKPTEHFVNGGSMPSSIQPSNAEDAFGIVEVDAHPYSGPSLPDYTPPTSKNPFMNLLLDEYKYNPDRPVAAPIGNPTVKQTLDDFFRIHWYSDPTDVFGKNQNQRQFVTQPSTTVPNDQGSFANWLYKIPGKTCKEGGRDACLAGTDGGLMPWLSHSS